MSVAKNGDQVKVRYVGKFEDGVVFDTSEGQDALEFTIGQQEVIPGFDLAVVGMKVGESKTVNVPADQAYGPVQDELVAELERKDLPADIELVVGNHLEVSQDDGSTFSVNIADLTETTVTLDANHPLAGKDLTFEINLVEIA